MFSLLTIGALGVYWVTLAPSVYWGDSAEFQRVAYTLEVPHPSGYPLYILLTHAWIESIPYGSVAWRVNLFSALTAGMSVAVLYLVVLAATERIVAAVLAALLLATSASFWSQAVIAEVYGLHALVVSLLLLELAVPPARWKRQWYSVPILLGMGLSHHKMALLLLPGLGLALIHLWRKGLISPTRVHVRKAAGAFAVGLSPYLFLYWSSDWETPQTFISFVLDGGGWFALEGLASHFRSTVLPLLLQQLGALGLVFMLLGMFSSPDSDSVQPHIRLLLGVSWCVALMFLTGLRVADLYAFFPHIQVLGAVMFGLGVANATSWIRRRVPLRRERIASAGLLLLFLGLMVQQGYDSWLANDLSDDWTADRRTRQVLTDVSEDSLLAAGWLMGQPLLYQQSVEKLRPDVVVRLDATRDLVHLQSFRQSGRDVFLWAVGWEPVVEQIGGSLEAVRPEVHDSQLYPIDSFDSFDAEVRTALAANHGLRRFESPGFGRVQGLKIDGTDRIAPEAMASHAVLLDGIEISGKFPGMPTSFVEDGVVSLGARHELSVVPPAGLQSLISICTDEVTCHSAGGRPASTVTFVMPDGGFVDIHIEFREP